MQKRPARQSRAKADHSAAPPVRVYGMAAALAVLERRPEQVKRIAHTPAARKRLGPALSRAARLRIAYREVSEEELSRIAGSVHHEGICLLVAERPEPSLDELARGTGEPGLLLALDRVSNPHNAGAILRTAAFFGASGMLLSGFGGKRPGLPSASVRIAEGGAEYVPVARVAELPDALRTLSRAGLPIVGADTRAQASLDSLRWPERCVLVLGNEETGLSPPVRARCDATVQIGGRGAIESLNVSVAAGVLLASFWRGRGR